MSEFTDYLDILENKIRDLGERMYFGVYDGAIPTGEELYQTNGRYWPYVVFSFGGKTDAARRQKGITNSRDDVKNTSLVFYCVGDSPLTVRRLKDVLRTEFEGYCPGVGWGQYEEVLTGDFGVSKPDPDLIPLRYGETLAFKNMTDV